MLGEGDTFGINKNFGVPEKGLVLVLVKQTQDFAWVYIIMLIKVILFVNGKEKFKFKADNKNVNFRT